MASIMLDVNGLARLNGYIRCTCVYSFTYAFTICLPIKVIWIKYKPTYDSNIRIDQWNILFKLKILISNMSICANIAVGSVYTFNNQWTLRPIIRSNKKYYLNCFCECECQSLVVVCHFPYLLKYIVSIIYFYWSISYILDTSYILDDIDYININYLLVYKNLYLLSASLVQKMSIFSPWNQLYPRGKLYNEKNLNTFKNGFSI